MSDAMEASVFQDQLYSMVIEASELQQQQKASTSSSNSKSNESSNEPTIYKKSGTFETNSKSTGKGKHLAIMQFNKFLQTKNMSQLADYQNSNYEELLDLSLLQEFGTYLARHARGNTNELLMGKTPDQYLSGVKTQLKELRPDHSLFNNESKWYTPLRRDVSRQVAERCILEGIPVSEKAKPIGRIMMNRIGQLFI